MDIYDRRRIRKEQDPYDGILYKKDARKWEEDGGGDFFYWNQQELIAQSVCLSLYFVWRQGPG